MWKIQFRIEQASPSKRLFEAAIPEVLNRESILFRLKKKPRISPGPDRTTAVVYWNWLMSVG